MKPILIAILVATIGIAACEVNVPEGKPGPAGAKGSTGAAGSDGSAGAAGAEGATGATGSAGKPATDTIVVVPVPTENH